MRLLPRLFAGLLLCVPLVAMAAQSDPPYQPGFDYVRISPAPQMPTNSPAGKVQVAEFFWYDCPHCAHIEPELQRWRASALPKNADFVRIPAVLAPKWGFMARVYYAARLLGVEQRMTPLIFHAIHDQRRALDNLQAMMNFFVVHGVPADKFKTAMDSLEVDMQVRDAVLRTREYGVQGVPSLVIDGRYRVSATLTGSYARMFKVAAWLTDRLARGETIPAG